MNTFLGKKETTPHIAEVTKLPIMISFNLVTVTLTEITTVTG